MGYDSEWEAEWARELRVCASSYFHKFFAYGVSVSQLSDRVIQGFLDALPTQTADEQDAALRVLATPEAVASLVHRLRQRESHVPGDAGPPPLAKLVARDGEVFPLERGAFSSGGPRTQAAIVVYHLIKSVPFAPQRFELATETLRHAHPVTFAGECLRWLSPSPRKPEYEWVFDQASFDRLHELVVRDLIVPADAREPLYRQFGSESTYLYSWWHKVDAAGVSARLRGCLDAAPDDIDHFLDAFVGEAWELGTGLSHRTDLDRDVYDELARLVEPADIARRLRERYGAQLDDPRFRHGNEISLPIRIAHQFAYVHAGVLAEARDRAVAAAPRRADEADDNNMPPIE